MTSPTVLQLAFALVFGLLIVRLLRQIAQGETSLLKGLFWCALWGLGLIFVLQPELAQSLAGLLGVTRGTDAVLYTALALLSVLQYRTFQLLDGKEREVSRLTEEMALLRWEVEKKNRPGAEETLEPTAAPESALPPPTS